MKRKAALKKLPAQLKPVDLPAVVKRADLDDVIARLLDTPTKENVDLIERLLDMRAERAFNVAMRDAQAEMPRIFRDATNESTRSRFARLETIAKHINPLMTKHGFAPSFGTADTPLPGHYRVTCELAHVAGKSRHYQMDIPADNVGMKGSVNKTPTHAAVSAMTYGRRNLLTLMFNVVLTNEDDDGVAAGIKPLTDEQLENLKDLLKTSGLNEKRFLATFNIADINELPANKIEEAITRIAFYSARKTNREMRAEKESA